jgi:hypothetical protein
MTFFGVPAFSIWWRFEIRNRLLFERGYCARCGRAELFFKAGEDNL